MFPDIHVAIFSPLLAQLYGCSVEADGGPTACRCSKRSGHNQRHHETIVRIGGGSLQTETKQRENPDH